MSNVILIVNDGYVNRVKVKNYQKQHTYAYLTQDGRCFGRTSNFCKFGSAEKKIILLGDSHFGSLAFDLRKRIETNYTFLPIVMPGYFHLKESQLINKNIKINIYIYLYY